MAVFAASGVMRRRASSARIGWVLRGALFAVLAAAMPFHAAFGAEPDWVKGRRFTVAFAQDNLANDWRAAQVRQLREALEPYPFIAFGHSDARGDAARQVRDMEDFIARRVHVLVTSPQDPERARPILALAAKARIPVVLLSRTVPGGEFTSFIAPDNTEIGRQAARFLAERTKTRTRVVILQGLPTSTAAIERTEGFREELSRHAHLGIAALKPANYLRADALRAMEDILAAKIPFDAIYAQSDSMAIGARVALRQAGIDPASIPTVGIDYIQESRAAIRAGEQTASFLLPTGAKEGAEIILRILKGETVPKTVVIPSQLVTRDNVERVEPIF